MKSSGIFSAANPGSPLAGPPRSSFALDGPSTKIDPLTKAVRRDLADIRLAEFVFAPHYAAPLSMAVTRAVSLRAGPKDCSETLAELAPGAIFEALDFAGGLAWGIAVAIGLVGYVERSAIDFAPVPPPVADA